MHILPIIIILLGMTQSSLAVDSTTPLSLSSYSTIHSIGFEWTIQGDDDHDATCSVQYRILGASSWNSFIPLYRVDFQNKNMLAGSILFLKENSTYEIQLSLVDVDGGSITLLDTVATKKVPVQPNGGNQYHVIPGSGGGDGSAGNPFQGIDAAEQVVQPGDIVLVHGGNYGGTVFFDAAGSADNHVVWKSAGDGDAIFEGIRVTADFVWFEELTIANQQYGLRTTSEPYGIVVNRCTFLNNHYGIYLNDGGECWYIADNTIIGDNDPSVSNFGGEGIELYYTNGHTVAHNTISRVADGISYPGQNVDLFGNDIFDTSDDGIEFDYGLANNRAWKNRITNPFNNGISFQPMNGSPYYILFNQVSVLNGQSVLKLRDRSDRALIAHNTFIINSGPMASGSQYLNNFEIKNNLWISINDRYAWENGVSTSTNWKTDFDYDGFDWGNYAYAFKWSDIRLDNISDFHALTGQEQHGIPINHNTCFERLNYTEDPNQPGQVDSFHIEYNTLDPACNAVDAGTLLPGINTAFNGSAPDLGAYEIGMPLPEYGVRPLCSADSITWIGPIVGNWYDDPGYWDQSQFPINCHEVILPAGYAITINQQQVTIRSLEVSVGTSFVAELNSLIWIE